MPWRVLFIFVIAMSPFVAFIIPVLTQNVPTLVLCAGLFEVLRAVSLLAIVHVGPIEE